MGVEKARPQASLVLGVISESALCTVSDMNDTISPLGKGCMYALSAVRRYTDCRPRS